MQLKKKLFFDLMKEIVTLEEKRVSFEQAFRHISSEGLYLDFVYPTVDVSVKVLSNFISIEKESEIEEWINWWLYDTERGKRDSLKARIPEIHSGEPFSVTTLDLLWSIIETYLDKEVV